MNALSVLVAQLRRSGAPVVWHTVLYSGSAAALKLAGFVISLWMARSLSVDEYAHWGILYSLQTAVTLGALVGIIEAVIGLLNAYRTTQTEPKLFAAANTVFLVNAGLASALGLAVFFLVARNESWRVGPALGVIASGCLMAFAMLQAQIVRLEENHLGSVCFIFLVPAGGLIASAAAVFLCRSAGSYFVGAAVGLLLSLLLTRLRGMGSYGFERGFAECRPVLKRLWPFVAVTFLGWFGGYGNTLVLKGWFASEDVAKFTLAYTVSAGLQLIASSMNQAWSPRFFRMTHNSDTEAIEAENRIFYWWQGVALGITGAALIALFPILEHTIGGNLAVYGSLAKELFVLVIAYVALIPFWHCQNYFLAYDMGKVMMQLHVVAGVISLGLLIGLMMIYGVFGIYLGFLAQMIIRSIGAVLIARKHWRIHISWAGIAVGIVIPLSALFCVNLK